MLNEIINYNFEILVSKFPIISYLGNEYVVSVLILLGSALLALLLIFIFKNYLERFAAKTETELDDLILERVKRPFFYLILAQGLKLALFNLQFNNQYLTSLVNTLMALVFVFILSRIVDVIIDVWGHTFAAKTETKLDEVLLPLFHKFSKVIFIVVALMWVLNIWNVNITPYLAGVGISGIVIGLALQDSLKNIIGGVSLILDDSLKIGDKIKLESGEVGEVFDVGLRSTKMRTYDNEILTIPNGYLANTRVQNYTQPNPKMRVYVDFGVEYGTNPDKVKKIILTALKNVEKVLDDPVPAVQFVSMGDSALNFKLYFWVKNWKDAYSKKLEATDLVYKTLNKAKIGIPFPTQTVFVKKSK
ncbi:mechanosensitive ion channel family protein [archaeon]|nr:mechanosensitive ion channel family protein [archaeon]